MAPAPLLQQEQQHRTSRRSLLLAWLRRHRRRIAALVVVALFYHIFFFSGTTPASLPPVKPPPRKVTPARDLDPHPHFLYHSSFRANPDLEYETRLDDALLELERRVTREESRDVVGKTLWQIMLGPAERGPDSYAFERRNSGWNYQAVHDDWANTFINTTFLDIPDLARLYHEYPHDVLRADLLRYLILWFYGGYYADTDIKPARAIDDCPPLAPVLPRAVADTNADTALADTALDVSLVVGIEIDEPWASARLMRRWHWIRTYGFIQYNLYAPQRFSPILRRAIVRALAHTRAHHRAAASAWWRWPLTAPRYDERTILEISGPGVFTDAILDVLSETLAPAHPLVRASLAADADAGELALLSAAARQAKIPRVTWAPFHKLRQPLWVPAEDARGGVEGGGAGAKGRMGGLGVMPISVWGNGQRHSEAEGFSSRQACVNHRFKGTWKKSWWQRWKEA